MRRLEEGMDIKKRFGKSSIEPIGMKQLIGGGGDNPDPPAPPTCAQPGGAVLTGYSQRLDALNMRLLVGGGGNHPDPPGPPPPPDPHWK